MVQEMDLQQDVTTFPVLEKCQLILRHIFVYAADWPRLGALLFSSFPRLTQNHKATFWATNPAQRKEAFPDWAQDRGEQLRAPHTLWRSVSEAPVDARSTMGIDLVEACCALLSIVPCRQYSVQLLSFAPQNIAPNSTVQGFCKFILLIKEGVTTLILCSSCLIPTYKPSLSLLSTRVFFKIGLKAILKYVSPTAKITQAVEFHRTDELSPSVLCFKPLRRSSLYSEGRIRCFLSFYSMSLYSKLDNFRSSRFLILFTICTAMFTDGFIYGIVAPVIPFALQDQKLVSEGKRKMTAAVLYNYQPDFFGARKCPFTQPPMFYNAICKHY
ncbi:uncharacterized protein BDR25DRAFT_356647 [Lindgomyces ingoldianus]|uniref:Uncharacterized protein n=1 Tax=Lindgomyces ingoldianus TaxID=673940 RepID=A0ACB6QTK7_9PLEO|nr:uncharacterized protein BDR25DRAFT_356647 [Lindgomyces ingoldianus]KAF2469417.1 hypothetical protein BDR25DRAFT_356647 [Lindgomyces ingoldianus]